MTPSALQTERVRLEPINRGHAEATAALMSENIARFLLTWPARLDEAQATALIDERLAQGSACGDRHFAVTLRATGDFAGWASLLSDPDPHRVKIGIWLGELYWGRGLGSEVVGGLIDHLREAGEVAEVIAEVRPDNERSIAMVDRLGFRRTFSTVTETPATQDALLCFAYPIAADAIVGSDPLLAPRSAAGR